MVSLDLTLMLHVSGVSMPLGSQVFLPQPPFNPHHDQVSALVSVLDPVPCLTSVSRHEGEGRPFFCAVVLSAGTPAPQGGQAGPKQSLALMLPLPQSHTGLAS